MTTIVVFAFLVGPLAGCLSSEPKEQSLTERLPDVPMDALRVPASGAALQAVKQVEQITRGLRLTLTGATDQTMVAEFVTPSVVRFRLDFNQTKPATPGPDYLTAVLDVPDLSTAVGFVEREHTYVLSTQEAALVVSKQPFGFQLYDAEGRWLVGSGPGGFSYAPSKLIKSGLNHPYYTSTYGVNLRIDTDDYFYGFGERFNAAAQRGTRLESYICDCLQVGDYIRKGDTYYVVPFFWNPRGWGAYVDSTSDIRFDIGKTSPTEFHIEVPQPGPLDIYWIAGTPKEIIGAYTGLTGLPRLPPKWAFEQWVDGLYGDVNRRHGPGDQAIKDYIALFEQHKIPIRTVTLENDWTVLWWFGARWTWNRAAFPDPKGFVDWLHGKGYRAAVWETPAISPLADKWAEAAAAGYFAKDKQGRPYVITPQNSNQNTFWMQGVSIVDFTNPRAVEWWKAQHRELMQIGIDGYKADGGEEPVPDMYFHNGETGITMHNKNAMLYNLALQDQLDKERGGGATFGRSGTVGSQRTSGMWAGDQFPDDENAKDWYFTHTMLYGGLSSVSSGLYWYTFDVCGLSNPCPREQFLRSSQINWFMPWWKAHISFDHPRAPWDYDQKVLDSTRMYSHFRQSLLDYSYMHAERANTTGVPMVRPLAMEWPEDNRTWSNQDEFIHGDHLLVAPIMKKGATSRDVYLPKGTWKDLHSGEIIQGPSTLTGYEAPTEKLPLFWRTDVGGWPTPDVLTPPKV